MKRYIWLYALLLLMGIGIMLAFSDYTKLAARSDSVRFVGVVERYNPDYQSFWIRALSIDEAFASNIVLEKGRFDSKLHRFSAYMGKDAWHKIPYGTSIKEGAQYEFVARLRPIERNALQDFPSFYDVYKIAGSATIESLRLLDDAPASSFFARMRLKASKALHEDLSFLPPNISSVLVALTLGEGSFMESSDWKLWRESGLLHVIVVSGMHITLFFAVFFFVIYWLLWLPSHFLPHSSLGASFGRVLKNAPNTPKKPTNNQNKPFAFLSVASLSSLLSRNLYNFYQHGTHKNIAIIGALLLVEGYAFLVGFQGSSARSGVMILFPALSGIWAVRFAPYFALLVSFLALVFLGIVSSINTLYSPGIFLSYSAILGIYFAIAKNGKVPWLDYFPSLSPHSTENFHAHGKKSIQSMLLHALNRAGFYLWTLGKIQLFIFLLSTPVLIFFFQEVFYFSSFINFFAIPLMDLVLVPLALLGLVLYFLWSFGGIFIFFLIGKSFEPLILMLEYLQETYLKSIVLASSFWVCFLAFLGSFLFLLFKKRWRFLCLVLWLPLLGLSLVSFEASIEHAQVRIEFVNSYPQNIAIIKTQNHQILYGINAPRRRQSYPALLPYLSKQHTRFLDAWVLSNPSKRQKEEASALLEHLIVDQKLGFDGDCLEQSWRWDGVDFFLVPMHDACALLIQIPKHTPVKTEASEHLSEHSDQSSTKSTHQRVLLLDNFDATSMKDDDWAQVNKHGMLEHVDVLFVPNNGYKRSFDSRIFSRINPKVSVFAAPKFHARMPNKDVKAWYVDASFLMHTAPSLAIQLNLSPKKEMHFARIGAPSSFNTLSFFNLTPSLFGSRRIAHFFPQAEKLNTTPKKERP